MKLFALKTPIRAPKNWCFGVFHPQNGEQYQRNPKKAHLRVGSRGVLFMSVSSIIPEKARGNKV